MSTQLDDVLITSNCLREEIFTNSKDTWAYEQHLIEFCTLQVALAMGDEIDKQGISLVGKRDTTDMLKQSKHPDCSVIGMDPNCPHCQCQSVPERTALLQSFKIACLAYNPSEINVPTLSQKALSRVEVVNH